MEKLTGTAITNALIMGFIIGVALGGFIAIGGGFAPLLTHMPRMSMIAAPNPMMAPAVVAPPVAEQPQQEASASVQAAELKVVATDLKFGPNTLKAKVGQPLKVVLENKGVIEHDLAFVGLKATSNLSPDLKTPMVKPGQTASIELTPTAKGTYEFVCTVPGHKEAGMRGTLTVSD
jgi:uncharacterized cupredoxin-like copper-binding protein